MVDKFSLAKAGYRCPMCGSSDFHFCYHEHQLMDSAICESCGIRWREDAGEIGIWRKYFGDEVAVGNPSSALAEAYVKELTAYRQNRPYAGGIYRGIPVGGFVWVLHKTGEFEPVRDSRSSDEVKFKSFGRNRKNMRAKRK